MKCIWHLCDVELVGRQSAYCGVKCKNKYQVTAKRRSLKLEMMKAAGNKCVDCGVTGPPYMFDFDHRDPAVKEFSISNFGKGTSKERLLAEAAKCDLVCANCHRQRTHVQRCVGCEYCQ